MPPFLATSSRRRHTEPLLVQSAGQTLVFGLELNKGGNYNQESNCSTSSILFGDEDSASAVVFYNQSSRSSTGSKALSGTRSPELQVEKSDSDASAKEQQQSQSQSHIVVEADYDYWVDVADSW